MEAKWFHVEKRNRCSDCKHMVETAWCCYNGRTCIMTLCDLCTAKRLEAQ